MGVQPGRGIGANARPLLESDIKRAQEHTKSAIEASRYLNVNYSTYKKYARMYGLFEGHKSTGKGIRRKRTKGFFGLDSILAGEHPTYDQTKLKERLIRAGYLEESCVFCGFDKKREIDGRCPLVLHQKDDNRQNLVLENLDLRCYNCTYLTTGRVRGRAIMDPGVYDKDVIDTGITMDEIQRIQEEMMGE